MSLLLNLLISHLCRLWKSREFTPDARKIRPFLMLHAKYLILAQVILFLLLI
jgi:hypothetical protein